MSKRPINETHSDEPMSEDKDEEMNDADDEGYHAYSSLFNGMPDSDRSACIRCLVRVCEQAVQVNGENWNALSLKQKEEKWCSCFFAGDDIIANLGVDLGYFYSHLKARITAELPAFLKIVESKAEASQSSISVDGFLPDMNITEDAWKARYEIHGGEEAFWSHLKQQKAAYKREGKNRYPFFSIIQSSGYGKSRLMDHIRATTSDDSPVIYLSFAPRYAWPKSNVGIDVSLEMKGRDKVEKAFVQLFNQAVTSNSVDVRLTLDLKEAADGFEPQTFHEDKNVLIVLDEVSQLLSRQATPDVDFFRCLRKACKTYSEKTGSFFVLLSTYSSVNQLMPGRYFDPSAKFLPPHSDATLEPMAPFLLQHAIGLRNNPVDILAWTVEECHDPARQLTMGRPMWHAFLHSREAQVESPVRQVKLVHFALSKLLQRENHPRYQDLTLHQLLALFSCRACLTISPISRYAPAMVASHMATAVSISTTGDEIVVSYPSEPILALASRSYYVKEPYKSVFLQDAFSQLKEYFISGAVEKGHRAELIVRLLTLLAIDECMKNAGDHEVAEVKLSDFLAKFDRDVPGAKISDILRDFDVGNAQLTDKQKAMLKREGILEGAIALAGHDFPVHILDNGRVCFTHFVYLSGGAKISPDLLRYAYRRTAAIVVNAGRRGIDWIIPVRLKNKNGVDEFVGLAGQDKNRMRDTLEALTQLSSEATHHKVSAEYFLTKDEKDSFQTEGWALNWPAVLFSIGTDDVGAALAKQAIRKRSRGDGETEEFQFPCIVLTGLSYNRLMERDCDEVLRQFRDSVIEVPSTYREKVPLTYGMP